MRIFIFVVNLLLSVYISTMVEFGCATLASYTPHVQERALKRMGAIALAKTNRIPKWPFA